MKKRLTFFGGLLLGLVSGWGLGARAQEALFLSPPVNTVFAPFQNNVPALNWQQPLESDDFQAYLDFYQLNFNQTRHYAGRVPMISPNQQLKLFVHVLQPLQVERPQGTVVAIHGYLAHSGLMRFLAEDLLKANYQVVLVDLPGHGLSTGSMASIQDFGHYADILKTLTPQLTSALTGPYYLLGHSTGGTSVWTYLLSEPNHPYRKAVLAAPLVRSYLWELSGVGFQLGQSWLENLPRVMTVTSQDPSFNAFVRQDPLQSSIAPVQWVRALIEWNTHQVPHYPQSQIPLLLIQGQADTVVDWSYNVPYLKGKFPQSQVHWIPASNHDIFWELPPIRSQALEQIQQFLVNK